MITVDGIDYCDVCDYFAGAFGCTDGVCRRPRNAAVARAHVYLAEAEGSLEGWREPDGLLLPTEPDPAERERVRERLKAVIFACRRVLGMKESA